MDEKELNEIEVFVNTRERPLTENQSELMRAYTTNLLTEVKRLRGIEHFCYECHSDHSYGECPKEDNNPQGERKEPEMAKNLRNKIESHEIPHWVACNEVLGWCSKCKPREDKMSEKTFETKDLILPTLELPDPCPIKIRITDECVYLYVGQRDWQWKLSDGSMVGAGTELCSEGQNEDEEWAANPSGDPRWFDSILTHKTT